MLKWWVYIFIAIFILDVIYRTFINHKININSFFSKNFSRKLFDNDLPKNMTNEERNNDLKYDKIKFEPEIIHFHSRKNNKKKIEIVEEEDDLIYSPQNKIKEIDEDDIEFEGLIPKPQKRINVTIEFDEKYQNLYNELSTQLDGNISYLKFYPKIVSIQGGKKVIKYFLYFCIFISFLFIFFLENIINCCCIGMNENLKSLLSTIKYFIFGFLYLFYMYIIKKVSHTNIFEVYVNKQLKYSTIVKEEPPTYVILYNILKNINNNK